MSCEFYAWVKKWFMWEVRNGLKKNVVLADKSRIFDLELSMKSIKKYHKLTGTHWFWEDVASSE